MTTDTETLRKLVKPLVWTEEIKGRFVGEPPNGIGQLAFWVFDELPKGYFRPSPQGKQYHPNLESAKAAAQADYEARILAALTPSPEAQEQLKVMREALEPFAQAIVHIYPELDDEYRPRWAEFFTAGDFRRADRAIASVTAAQEGA